MKTIIKSKALLAILFATMLFPFTLPGQPDYLSASVEANDVTLSWGVSGDDGQWLTYDTGDLESGLGISEPGIYHIASRWPSAELTEGNQISRMAFFPIGEFNLYTIKIWKGENAGELIYSREAFDLDAMQWNEILLDTPVFIEEGEEYWFGLEINQVTDFDFGAAFDSGPAVEGFGDMINLGGDWVSVSQYG